MIPLFPSYIFVDDSSLLRKNRDNVLKSEMEVGPQKTRPIQSRPMFEVNFDVSICEDKLTEFNLWFRTTAGYGAYWFRLNDPFDGVQKRFRFLETALTWKKTGNVYQSTFSLEGYDE